MERPIDRLHVTAAAPLTLLVTIVDRKRGERVAELLRGAGLPAHTLLLGRGTATSEIMDCLGLGEPKKDVLLTVAPAKRLTALLETLRGALGLDKKGRGIAFALPVCGALKNLLSPLTGETLCIEHMGRETHMQRTEHKLVVAVVTRGGSDTIMEAAKAAGATGGTVLGARGAGIDETSSFLGLTIQPEKELVAILLETALAEPVMRAIDERIAHERDLTGLVVCLNVEGCTGI